MKDKNKPKLEWPWAIPIGLAVGAVVGILLEDIMLGLALGFVFGYLFAREPQDYSKKKKNKKDKNAE